MRRFPFIVAVAAAQLSRPASSVATEWQDLKAQYDECTLLAGLGAGNGPDNPNEWNDAEGQPATLAELSEPHSAPLPPGRHEVSTGFIHSGHGPIEGIVTGGRESPRNP